MDSQRVTMVTLAVSDLAVSRGFYAALGWEEADGGNEDIAFFKLRGFFLSLYARAKLEADLGRAVPALATGAVTLATNYGDVAQVDAAFGAAIAAGATAVTQPEKVFWGGYSGTFCDPDGHLWEVAHNPFWAFDDEGYLA